MNICPNVTYINVQVFILVIILLNKYDVSHFQPNMTNWLNSSLTILKLYEVYSLQQTTEWD